MSGFFVYLDTFLIVYLLLLFLASLYWLTVVRLSDFLDPIMVTVIIVPWSVWWSEVPAVVIDSEYMIFALCPKVVLMLEEIEDV